MSSVLKEEEEGQYLFVIADLKKANIFLFDKDEVASSKSVMDPGVKKRNRINSGELYGRNNKQSNHINNQINQHLQCIMLETRMLIAGKHINGVFLGGHKPFFHLMVEALPSDLQKKLRGEFITELNISQDELIKNCKQILQAYKKD